MGTIIDLIVIITIICWILTGIQGYRMVRLFKKKNPEIAKKKIPSAFASNYKDNFEINLFFFRKENIPLLQKDQRIWRLRQQTKILFTLSIGAPLLIAFLSIFIFMNQ